MGSLKCSRATLVLAGCLLAAGCVTVNSPRAGEDERVGPVAWGILSKPDACVIFREYGKTKLGFFVVAVTAKTEGYLEVLESTGYDMPSKVWPQTTEGMDQLHGIATRDSVRFVKLQDGYSDAELEAARALCAQETASS